jgi:hypothetical protein
VGPKLQRPSANRNRASRLAGQEPEKKKKKDLVMPDPLTRDVATIPSLLQVLVYPDYAPGLKQL